MKVVIDIGGTNTRVAISRDGKSLNEIKKYLTPSDYQKGLTELENAISELAETEQIESIVCGFPSLADSEGRLHNVVNLPEWSGQKFASDLSELMNGLAVKVESDVVLAALAEAANSTTKDEQIVAYVTYSTGINAVKIVDGKLDKNSLGFEAGHQIVDYDSDTKCEACGTYGDLESLIGGRAIEKRYGKKPAEIQENGFWENVEKIFAVGLHNTILHFSPDVVIIGGPMMNDVSIENLETHLEKSLKILPKTPRLLKGNLDNNGLLGGLLIS